MDSKRRFRAVSRAIGIAVLIGAIATTFGGCRGSERKGDNRPAGPTTAPDKPAQPPTSTAPDAHGVPWGRPADMPASQSLKLEELCRNPVAPSDQEQTVSWQDQVVVKLPGGEVRSAGDLVISRVQDLPAPGFEGYARQAVYDVSLAGRSRFDKEITLELAYDRSKLSADLPAEAQVWVEYYEPHLRSWLPVRCSVDAARGKAVAHTRHLSAFAVLNPQGGGDYNLWIGREKPIGRDVFAVIHYNDKLVRGETTSYRDAKIAMELKKLDSDKLPGYIAKMADMADAAIQAYAARGLKVYSSPLHLYVESRKATPDSWHNEWTGHVTMNTSARSLEMLRYAVAHEIFHNVQLNWYWAAENYSNRDWLETTAEYAACRIAMPSYDYMGKLDVGERVNSLPRYLTKDLTYFCGAGGDGNPWRSHEYAASYFLDHLGAFATARGSGPPQAFFARMVPAVGKNGGWEALDGYLTETFGAVHDVAHQYPPFAIGYLLGSRSPLYFREEDDVVSYRTSGPVHEKALEQSLSLAADEKPTAVQFSLDEKLTAKAVGVTCSSTDAPRWHAKVELDGAPSDGVTLWACRLPGNDRQNGYESQPVEAGKGVLLSMASGDGLYLVACSTQGAGSASANVTVLPAKGQGFAHNLKQPIPGHGVQVDIAVSGEIEGPTGGNAFQVRPISRTLVVNAPAFLEPTNVAVQAAYRVDPKYRIFSIFEIDKTPTNCQVDITLVNPRLRVLRPDVKVSTGKGGGNTVSASFAMPSKNGRFDGSLNVYLSLDQQLRVSRPIVNEKGAVERYEFWKEYTQTLDLDVMTIAAKKPDARNP